MMVYLDTSVALAELLVEDRKPKAELWSTTLFSSRLLEYETWIRINARRLAKSHGDAARHILSRVNMVELRPEVLERALERFPTELRTLDALHLATFDFLRRRGIELELATFDDRMRKAAKGMGFTLFDAA